MANYVTVLTGSRSILANYGRQKKPRYRYRRRGWNYKVYPDLEYYLVHPGIMLITVTEYIQCA
jgi:hypothetical protein